MHIVAFSPGVMFTLALFADICDEPSSLGISHPIRFDQAYEGKQSVGLAIFFFLIGKAGETPEMAPVRRPPVAAEVLSQFPCSQRAQLTRKLSRMFEPRLKVAW